MATTTVLEDVKNANLNVQAQKEKQLGAGALPLCTFLWNSKTGPLGSCEMDI
jgi:hypothetical protein